MKLLILFQIVCTVQLIFCVNMFNYFDGDCPEGWKEYNQGDGRVIISSGNGVDINNFGKTFNVGSSGGQYQKTLSIDNMPKHNHNNGEYKYLLRKIGKYTTDGDDYSSIEPDIRTAAQMLD